MTGFIDLEEGFFTRGGVAITEDSYAKGSQARRLLSGDVGLPAEVVPGTRCFYKAFFEIEDTFHSLKCVCRASKYYTYFFRKHDRKAHLFYDIFARYDKCLKSFLTRFLFRVWPVITYYSVLFLFCLIDIFSFIGASYLVQ